MRVIQDPPTAIHCNHLRPQTGLQQQFESTGNSPQSSKSVHDGEANIRITNSPPLWLTAWSHGPAENGQIVRESGLSKVQPNRFMADQTPAPHIDGRLSQSLGDAVHFWLTVRPRVNEQSRENGAGWPIGRNGASSRWGRPVFSLSQNDPALLPRVRKNNPHAARVNIHAIPLPLGGTLEFRRMHQPPRYRQHQRVFHGPQGYAALVQLGGQHSVTLRGILWPKEIKSCQKCLGRSLAT
jgi:hypothetical protein